MHDTILSPWLRFGLWCLRHHIRQTRQRDVGSAICQGLILQHLQEELAPTLQRDKQVQSSLTELRQRLQKQPAQHHVMQWPAYRGWKMAAHALPQGMRIPPHAHPGSLSLLLVMEGNASVEQYSLDVLTRERSHIPFRQTLAAGDGCVGLCFRHNAHAIQADGWGVLFLSLRLPDSNGYTVSWTQAFRKMWGWGLMLAAFASTSVAACPTAIRDASAQPSAEATEAEALYGQSLRSLYGEGVPVDRQKAIDLAFQAAKQGHQPAQKLYDDLLNGWYDEMTGC